MTSESTPRWYVAQTHPHAEAKAALHLGRQGFSVYLPRYLKRRRHARRTENVPAPLFPRYLFIAVDMATQRWRSIHSTIGVTRMVCLGDQPAAVDKSIIDGLRRREDACGFVQVERRIEFVAGDKIRVREGVFASCLGLFEGVTDAERVSILLDLLGRKVRVVLDVDFVAAA
jgi:transcriptional antiterminator RfaH